jgi:hypothetical protein
MVTRLRICPSSARWSPNEILVMNHHIGIFENSYSLASAYPSSIHVDLSLLEQIVQDLWFCGTRECLVDILSTISRV